MTEPYYHLLDAREEADRLRQQNINLAQKLGTIGNDYERQLDNLRDEIHQLEDLVLLAERSTYSVEIREKAQCIRAARGLTS